MRKFKDLCVGVIDGTFMPICKPVHGVAYWCYQRYPAIINFAVVNASGQFTFVDAGRAGTLGDAATYRSSRLEHNILQGSWLTIRERQEHRNSINGTYIQPYLIGDAAFPPPCTLMKCFNDNNGPPQPYINVLLIIGLSGRGELCSRPLGTRKVGLDF